LCGCAAVLAEQDSREAPTQQQDDDEKDGDGNPAADEVRRSTVDQVRQFEVSGFVARGDRPARGF
jgi:hypothetical protein